MNRSHIYKLITRWTGNNGSGTSGYKNYDRSYEVVIEGKPVMSGSSDPAFLGDATKYNPEDLLLASLSSCHMLWYLHLCSEAGVVVLDYKDIASGTMVEQGNKGGRFTGVTLNPVVTVAESSMIDKANELHKRANEVCYIANSVNFKVGHTPSCIALA